MSLARGGAKASKGLLSRRGVTRRSPMALIGPADSVRGELMDMFDFAEGHKEPENGQS
jgi:hypothetical protein